MLKENERLDCLIKEGYEIIQNDDVFSFSTDALLLGHLTEVRKNDRIMDLCSGNGVIPLLLAAKCNQKIEAIEIQDQLVEMARRSFVHNSLDERLTMYLMDLNNVYDTFKPSQYTLVTCNPPYFKVNQLNQHQKEAHKIARHEVMCDFTDCVKAARHLLREGGRFIVVHRADRLMDVLTEMRNGKIEPKKLTFVYSKANKSAQTIVVEGRKGGKQGLDIQQPFYIYNQDGTYSDEMKGIYYG
ncbi:tRNA1(Val) (adenine(37)-N6)-methyltransferase [Staphylococcus capitis]|uniref:tRNA1(Val) (adenine(37)-N6)-methyltransferase n=1 Tax=Staphylococcus capitis TaxID=29388 RepID=UPI000192912E|nr:tRNA1(Val) (adenine(37)-N6)-methyltransferase [Staphylococcus capitis]AKL93303.1 tRNA1(Val) (adenine(37)-N6)-methyltransferase [Staphylococcus capitis subsp. capitis]EEE48302.1 methyltransferase small domain protein [Staphylococcus capitis SK14]EGS39715.1 methyltransferase small domain protein [Staphylococcus capitis VCU116]MBN6786057.1 tRNA1(Val) (adenine(37)-N6)-methyltransferase [Staphylococcus capitis]MCC0831032.1 tRNA1(Val) (adenine(37)-N6)-methyltransferase [Staphylococcus capitis]